MFLHCNSFNAPFERDEGHYAYGSWLMAKGMAPYLDTFEQKPPMVFYPYLLALMINQDAFWPPRLVAAISLALTLLLLGLIVDREYGRRTAWLAVWLALPMIMFPHLKPFAANTEKFLLLPLIGLVAIHVFNKESKSAAPWFWAGVCGMIAVLYKQIAILPVLFVFGVWFFENRKRPAAGPLFAFAGTAAAFLLFTGYFLLRGALPAFWEQLVVYNLYYASSFGGPGLNWLVKNSLEFIAAWPLVVILLFWFLIKRPGRWWFYSGLLVVSLLTIFNSPYGHYYIMLMPFWAVVTAASLDSVIEWIKQRSKWAGWGPLLAFALVFSMVWPAQNYYLMPAADLVVKLYGPLNPFVEAPIVARHVALITRPDDRVFIAGTEQEILYYSKRLAPTRLGGMYGLMMEYPKALAYQKELVGDLERHPPKVIVMVRSPFSWLRQEKSPTLIFEYIDRLIRENYILVGGCVRRRDIAYWEEPLRKGDEFSCSMLVYKRKQK